jgi:hypothetical protein
METRQRVPPPGPQLLDYVSGRFRTAGTNLTQWSKDHNIKPQNARAYLLGQRNGPVAKQWRKTIFEAAVREGKTCL